MCFSPEADLATGVVVAIIGVDTLRHVERPQQLVLAGLPLLLAAHQIDESFVWWGLRGQVSEPVTHAAIYIFLAVAFLLPFLVPLALFGIEPVHKRRKWMAALLGVGCLTTTWLLIQIIAGTVGATIDGMHIAYISGGSYANLLGVLYILTTCGALLVASSRLLALFGVVNLIVVIILSWLTFTGLTSLWCAWAALTSVIIAVYLRRTHSPATPKHAPQHRGS